jgi:SAM-dependent methyltransferase
MALAINKHPILNAACKENPAQLALQPGDVNLDVNDYDPQERISLYQIPNFVCGSLLNIPFGDSHFGTVVLGEILEHCPTAAADRIMQEAKRVLQDEGRIEVSIPLDPRPPEVQLEPQLLITWEGGITSWHQNVWSDDKFADLLARNGLEELPEFRETLHYGFCSGTGAVLRKKLDADSSTSTAGAGAIS